MNTYKIKTIEGDFLIVDATSVHLEGGCLNFYVEETPVASFRDWEYWYIYEEDEAA